MAEPPASSASPVPPGLERDAGSDPLAETTLESRLAYDGVFFRVMRDRVRCADGHVAEREFIRHPGAVMIIAMPDEYTVLLERQFRYALGRSFIEMPAGKLEAGEGVLACAQRELTEETGYCAARWDRLGAFHNAIGYCDERIEVYLARELEFVGTATEAGEVLEVFTADWRLLLEWTRTGVVTDVKTIVGVHWLEHFLAGGPTAPAAGTDR